MKKFLSLLTVFMLAFSLAVPVGAVSPSGTSITVNGGTEVPLPEGQDVSYISTVINSGGGYKIIYDAMNGSYRYIVSIAPLDDTITDSATQTHRLTNNYDADNSYIISTYSRKNDSWSDNISGTLEKGKFLQFTASYLVADEDYFLSNLLRCDGSSCPAIDANIDGICDDCGMALMSLSRSPVAPDVIGNNKNYVMFYSGSVYQYTVYTSDSSYTIRGEEYGARYRTYLEPSVTATRFQSYDGINWEQTYNGKTSNDYPGEIGWELISSTYDWYNEEGERFFPVPLWEEVEKVTQGEMSNLTTETVGTMKTLVVCGVGLMACLMALSLFGKRWLLFLR